MAILHRAELNPTKLDLLARWLPTRPWYRGPSTPVLSRVSSFRFDDPAGEVGIETMLVRAGDGPVLQVPLTYRSAPIEGAQRWLLGSAEHSVLGTRYVYDGCGDPVYLSAVLTTIITGGDQAEQFIDVDGSLERREPSMTVIASGSGEAPSMAWVDRVDEDDPTVIVAGSMELTVVRVLGAEPDGDLTLSGTWVGQETPLLLVKIRIS